MTADNAPEKIYLDEDESWHLTNPNGDSIEYTRTDAFINKACSWFADRYQANGSYLCADDIEDFEKYMRGE